MPKPNVWPNPVYWCPWVDEKEGPKDLERSQWKVHNQKLNPYCLCLSFYYKLSDRSTAAAAISTSLTPEQRQDYWPLDFGPNGILEDRQHAGSPAKDITRFPQLTGDPNYTDGEELDPIRKTFLDMPCIPCQNRGKAIATEKKELHSVEISMLEYQDIIMFYALRMAAINKHLIAMTQRDIPTTTEAIDMVLTDLKKVAHSINEAHFDIGELVPAAAQRAVADLERLEPGSGNELKVMLNGWKGRPEWEGMKGTDTDWVIPKKCKRGDAE